MVSDVFRNGAFEPDDFRTLADDEPLPETGGVIVSFDRALAGGLPFNSHPVGVLIRPGDDVTRLGEDIHRFAVVAVAFPVFTDGRGYSTARLARERLGYRGEVRAVGNVLLDQIPLMRRCGIDTFVVAHEPTRRRLESGNTAEVSVYLQPIGQDEAAKAGRLWAHRKRV